MSMSEIVDDIRLRTRPASITAVRLRYGLTARALRLYEERGLIESIRFGGVRHYDRKNLARLKILLDCRAVGLSLREIYEILRRHRGDDHCEQEAFCLERFRAQIQKLEARQRSMSQALTTLENWVEVLSQGRGREDGVRVNSRRELSRRPTFVD